jgi:hypothetical protein
MTLCLLQTALSDEEITAVVRLMFDQSLTTWGSSFPEPFRCDKPPPLVSCILVVVCQRFLDVDCFCLPIVGSLSRD